MKVILFPARAGAMHCVIPADVYMSEYPHY